MQTAKQAAEKMLHGLPDDISFEDIQYHLYVLEKVQRGLDDIAQGRVSTQDEVEARLKAKWQK